MATTAPREQRPVRGAGTGSRTSSLSFGEAGLAPSQGPHHLGGKRFFSAANHSQLLAGGAGPGSGYGYMAPGEGANTSDREARGRPLAAAQKVR